MAARIHENRMVMETSQPVGENTSFAVFLAHLFREEGHIDDVAYLLHAFKLQYVSWHQPSAVVFGELLSTPQAE